jgi:hypothetical protein
MIIMIHYTTVLVLALTMGLIISLYLYPAQTKHTIRSAVSAINKFLGGKDFMGKPQPKKPENPTGTVGPQQNPNLATNDLSCVRDPKRKIQERTLKVMGCLDVSEFLGPDEISEVAQDKNIEAVNGEVIRKKLSLVASGISDGKRGFGRSKMEKLPKETPVEKKFSKSSWGELLDSQKMGLAPAPEAAVMGEGNKGCFYSINEDQNNFGKYLRSDEDPLVNKVDYFLSKQYSTNE